MQVLEFSSALNVVAWKVFLMLFGCQRRNIKHSSEKLMLIYIKRVLFYAIINNQFKTSDLKNLERLVELINSSSLKVLLEWTGNVHCCTICDVKFLVGGP